MKEKGCGRGYMICHTISVLRSSAGDLLIMTFECLTLAYRRCVGLSLVYVAASLLLCAGCAAVIIDQI